ncbi:MAG: YidC/Oxa1 family membrane protein insertase [Patescibacteria group bacterium]|nr:YidC/Oxa1 family membrane protein insertase [Patescibacteria group bacterium]
MRKNLLLFLLIFTTFLLFSKSCNGNTELTTSLNDSDIGLATPKIEYAYGKEVTLNIQNNLSEVVIIENKCPSPPLDIYRYENGEWLGLSATNKLDCANAQDIQIQPGEKNTLSYSKWTYSLFNELGRYQIRYELNEKTYFSNEFTIREPSMLTTFWREAFYKPIHNALIFTISILPGHSLALAIIIITLLVRTILLIPSQHALRSQRRLQEIQPKIEAVKKKYANNQEKIAMETMKVWQENKVNPFGSCLPLLIQFPILIALFYTIKEGLNPDKIALLYDFQQDFSLSSINISFLGIFDLTKIEIYFFPIAVGMLQFTQMKLALQRKKTKKDKKNEKSPAKKGQKQDLASDMENANKMMIYFMPLMIAFFTASIPSGVGLYWGTSTIYGIVQQVIVNKETPKNEPKVKVLDNK